MKPLYSIIFILLVSQPISAQDYSYMSEYFEKLANKNIPMELYYTGRTKVDSKTDIKIGLRRTGKIKASVLEVVGDSIIRIKTTVPVETYDGRVYYKVTRFWQETKDVYTKFNVYFSSTINTSGGKNTVTTNGTYAWIEKPYIEVFGNKITISSIVGNSLQKFLDDYTTIVNNKINEELN